MAGYLFLLGKKGLDTYTACATNGVYGTILKAGIRGFWQKYHVSTVADYLMMHPGDNVYFFFNRCIYGIGAIVDPGSGSKFQNYPQAGDPLIPDEDAVKDQLLSYIPEVGSNQRFICLFERSPYFFTKGVDMDDVLLSEPAAFRSLRVIWNRSFIQFDDEENQAFKNIIFKRNQAALADPVEGINVLPFSHDFHDGLKVRDLSQYSMASGVNRILQEFVAGTTIADEMALEMAIMEQMDTKDEKTLAIFGKWDYLAHQVVASPFKPVPYMDRMDIFGYRFLHGYEPTIQKYLVLEIKNDPATTQDVDQLLRYVDWVKDEYCHGDYEMIEAYLVASTFPEGLKEHAERYGVRKYYIGVRPAEPRRWFSITFVTYEYCEPTGYIDLVNAWDSSQGQQAETDG